MKKPMSAATWGTSLAILLSIIQAPTSQAAPTLAQVQAQSIQADIQKKAAELELKRQQMMMDNDLNRDKMYQEMALKKYELELKYNVQINTAEITAQQNIDRELLKQQGTFQ